MSRKPIVGIACNVSDLGGLPAHTARDTYIRALTQVSDCTPLLIPALGAHFSFADIADVVDGLLMTGSPSHVSPALYGKPQEFENEYLDCARDATTLPLIKTAIEADVPLLAICRGFQELNVTMGGTLHQKVHELPGKLDHRGRKDMPLGKVYELQAHKVTVQKGGLLERFGLPATFTVNTLHQQGVDTPAPALTVEAVSEDGIIESLSIPSKRFVLGTQWHPEGDFHLSATSRRIFEVYGEALHAQTRKKSSLRA